MWSGDRRVALAIGVVAAGAAVGALIAVTISVVDGAMLPSGPSFSWVPVSLMVGAIGGTFVGLAAAAGVIAGLAFTGRRSGLTTWQRAVSVGLIAAATASIAAVVLFNHPFILYREYLIPGTVVIVLVGVVTATGACEKRQRRGVSRAS